MACFLGKRYETLTTSPGTRADILDDAGEDKALAMYHLLSRNEVKGQYNATDIELLLEIIFELRSVYEKDVKNAKDTAALDKEDYEILYPLVFEAVREKEEVFKHVSHGYRPLCVVPTFTLALIMLSRIRRHYVHAEWFRLRPLMSMIGVHGSVSLFRCTLRASDDADVRAARSSLQNL